MARQFVYRERNTDTLQKRATQKGGSSETFITDEFKLYVPRKGENFIRILPPTWEGAVHYGYDVWAHYDIGPDHAQVICLYKQDNRHESCPICEAVQALDRAGEEEQAKALAAKRRVLVWLLDRMDRDATPTLWPMPWSVDRDIAKISQDRQSGEFYVVDHPTRGYDISFDKEGERVQTKYTGMQLAKRPTSVDPEFLEYVNECPLPETLLWRSYDEISELYSGGMDEREARRGTNGAGRAPARGAPPARRQAGPAQEPAQRREAPQRGQEPTRGGWTAPARRQAAPPADEEPPWDDEPPPDGEYAEGYEEPPPEDYEEPPPRRGAAPQAPRRGAAPPARGPQRQPPPSGGATGEQRATSLRERYARR